MCHSPDREGAEGSAAGNAAPTSKNAPLSGQGAGPQLRHKQGNQRGPQGTSIHGKAASWQQPQGRLGLQMTVPLPGIGPGTREPRAAGRRWVSTG